MGKLSKTTFEPVEESPTPSAPSPRIGKIDTSKLFSQVHKEKSERGQLQKKISLKLQGGMALLHTLLFHKTLHSGHPRWHRNIHHISIDCTAHTRDQRHGAKSLIKG